MNKHQVKRRIQEIKGKRKEVVGDILAKKHLEAEGLTQKNSWKDSS